MDKNRVVSFEARKGGLGLGWALDAVLESEVKGRKKWGRKMLTTRYVRIRTHLEEGEARRLCALYCDLLAFRDDVDRAINAVSGEVEISEDMRQTYVGAFGLGL